MPKSSSFQSVSMQLAVVTIIFALTRINGLPIGPKNRQAWSIDANPIPILNLAACMDDHRWTDKDGSGCNVYATAINKGQISMENACSYENDAAKKHCPVTCKECGCLDNAEWKDQDGDSCAVYAQAIEKGVFSLHHACTYEDNAAQKYCPRTCYTCPSDHPPPAPVAPSVTQKGLDEAEKELMEESQKLQGSLRAYESQNDRVSAPATRPQSASESHETHEAHETHESSHRRVSASSHRSHSASNKNVCHDDSEWKDQDGTACTQYAAAIKAGEFTMAYACAYDEGAAKKHCPMTCHSCPHHTESLLSRTTLTKETWSVIGMSATAMMGVAFAVFRARHSISTVDKEPFLTVVN